MGPENVQYKNGNWLPGNTLPKLRNQSRGFNCRGMNDPIWLGIYSKLNLLIILLGTEQILIERQTNTILSNKNFMTN